MRSKQIDAQRALSCGLVSELLPAKDFLPHVFAALEPLASDPIAMKALPAFKSLGRRVRDPLVREALVAEYVELDRRFLSGETYEAAATLFAQIRSGKSKL